MTDATPLPQQQPGAPPRLSPVLEELTKKTIDILARVIKKPPLTQKLLAKPPFRYLHDIFSELIRLCAFVPGLYSEAEMNSENIKVGGISSFKYKCVARIGFERRLLSLFNTVYICRSRTAINNCCSGLEPGYR